MPERIIRKIEKIKENPGRSKNKLEYNSHDDEKLNRWTFQVAWNFSDECLCLVVGVDSVCFEFDVSHIDWREMILEVHGLWFPHWLHGFHEL